MKFISKSSYPGQTVGGFRSGHR